MASTWFIVDVESDGPCPGLYSMVSIGAVRLDRELKTSFYGKFAPLPDADFQPEALAISGTTREEHLLYPNPYDDTKRLHEWVLANTEKATKPIFVSDNPAFDFAWVNYYAHLFLGHNSFGYSARRIGDLYSGLMKDASRSNEWRKFCKTKPTHHPVDDAMGVAEALLHMVDHMGLKIEGL